MHGAERPVRYQHDQLLIEWGRSSLHLLRGSVVIDGAQLLSGSLLAAWLVLGAVSRGARPGTTLLLVVWALTLPMLAREVAGLIRQFPAYRNILGRILEPLSAAEEPSRREEECPTTLPSAGVGITFTGVQVRIRGRRVLHVGELSIEPEEHVAVVGRSGAGKSTLAGLLLGWHTPASGTIHVDGVPLDARSAASLRQVTAWVDPSAHLWNQSCFDNLRYGDAGAILSSIGSIIEDAALSEVLEKLPSGLQSPLGEGGKLLSGGEGQRIRFGRALGRHPVRLALLDEPFRGLDRQRRHDLLRRARDVWRDQTMICVSHDIEETLAFDRVLVLDQGRIVEDGNPAELSQVAGSVYAELLTAEREVLTTSWAGETWRRWRLEHGAIDEQDESVEQSWTRQRQRSSGR
jgi:ATP-binding cassette subfamily B protein